MVTQVSFSFLFLLVFRTVIRLLVFNSRVTKRKNDKNTISFDSFILFLYRLNLDGLLFIIFDNEGKNTETQIESGKDLP